MACVTILFMKLYQRAQKINVGSPDKRAAPMPRKLALTLPHFSAGRFCGVAFHGAIMRNQPDAILNMLGTGRYRLLRGGSSACRMRADWRGQRWRGEARRKYRVGMKVNMVTGGLSSNNFAQ